MVKHTPQAALKNLQVTLTELEKQTLSNAVHANVQKAKLELEKLAEHLTLDAEQSRLAALYRVSQSLGSSLDLDEVLAQVLDAVIELTHAERGFLVLSDDGARNLYLRSGRSIEHKSLSDAEMEVSTTVIRTVIESGNGLVTTDAQNDPRFSAQASVMFYALRSVLCAPLRAHGETVGVIYVDNRVQAGIFTEDDLKLLSAFAAQAAIAIENARLYTRTDHALAARVAELETLSQIDRELNASLELDVVLEIAVRWAIQETGAAGGWAALSGVENPDLVVMTGSEKDRVLSPDDELVARCVRASEPLAFPAEGGTPARLVAPLLHSGQFIGLLAVECSPSCSEMALNFLGRLSSRAASAIQNARLFQSVQHAHTSKSKFISVVTHEIRIPMTSIKGYTDLLRANAVGPVNEMQLSFLNTIRTNVERMSVLVTDLSDINYMESGRLRFQRADLLLRDYVDETFNSLRPKIDERRQSVEIDIAGEPHVFADPQRLVQVLSNLVTNANKYTPEGGKISLRAMPANDFVRVEVTDNGIGISPEDQSNLFTQFFRSEDPAVREHQGWGLGLNVAKKLVEIMGGEIGAQSVLKEGSTFWFTLPMRDNG